MMFDPISSVSVPFSDLCLSDSDYFIEREDEGLHFLQGWYVSARDGTWEMHLDDARLVKSVTLYPRRFDVLDLPLDATRATIRYRFGEPAVSGNEPKLANIQEGAWDKYHGGALYYHFEYQAPLMKLVLVEVSARL